MEVITPNTQDIERAVTVNNEQLTVNNEQLTVNNEQLTVNNEQLTVNNEQLTVNNVSANTASSSVSDGIAVGHSDITENELKSAIRTIIRYIGEDPDREGLKNTPDRILRMYQEIFRGYKPEKKPRITTFPNSAHSTEMVFDSGDYYSMCEHHILPFFGKYYLAYIPSADGRILGISKVARVVGYCAAKLQLQERLCREIVEMLSEALKDTAEGFAIVMKGKHMCKSMRGVKNKGDMTVSYFTGCFKKKAQLRNEFYQLLSLNE